MNKRIEKKIFGRYGYGNYKDYKKKIIKPWKDYVREQKKWEKSGRPITREEAQTYLDLGLYTEDEIRSKFSIVD